MLTLQYVCMRVLIWQARREAEVLCPHYYAQCQQRSPFETVQQDRLLHLLFANKVPSSLSTCVFFSIFF